MIYILFKQGVFEKKLFPYTILIKNAYKIEKEYVHLLILSLNGQLNGQLQFKWNYQWNYHTHKIHTCVYAFIFQLQRWSAEQKHMVLKIIRSIQYALVQYA